MRNNDAIEGVRCVMTERGDAKSTSWLPKTKRASGPRLFPVTQQCRQVRGSSTTKDEGPTCKTQGGGQSRASTRHQDWKAAEQDVQGGRGV